MILFFRFVQYTQQSRFDIKGFFALKMPLPVPSGAGKRRIFFLADMRNGFSKGAGKLPAPFFSITPVFQTHRIMLHTLPEKLEEFPGISAHFPEWGAQSPRLGKTVRTYPDADTAPRRNPPESPHPWTSPNPADW